MSRIKIYRPELDAARGRTGALVSGCERAGQRAGSVAGAMYDMHFTGRDELIGELRSIESRLRKQAERMERLGKMIAVAGDELAAADTASGNSARSLWSRSGASLSGRTAKTALSLSSAAALERNAAAAGLFLSGGVSASFFGSIGEWLKSLFKKKKKKSKTKDTKPSGKNDHDSSSPEGSVSGSSVGGTIAVETTDSQYQANLEYQQKITDLKSRSGFGQGNEWGEVEYYGDYNGSYIGGSGCYVKAFQMQIELTGRKGDALWPGTKEWDYQLGSVDTSQIQRGDVVHYHWYEEGKYQQHYFYVVDVNSDNTISIGEGNHIDVNGNRIVNYNEHFDLNLFSTNFIIDQIYR